MATGEAYALGQLFGKIEGLDANTINSKADVFAAAIGKITGALTNNSPLVQRALGEIQSGSTGTGTNQAATDAFDNQILPQYEAFEKQMAADEQNYDSQRAQTVQSYEQQMADATETYESQRASIIESTEEQIANDTRNYEQQQATDSQNYQQQLAKDQRNYEQQEANAAASHALELQRLAQEYQDKVTSDAESRDALALVHDNQSYDEQVGT